MQNDTGYFPGPGINAFYLSCLSSLPVKVKALFSKPSDREYEPGPGFLLRIVSINGPVTVI